jgi:mannose-6-phosphate isomerase-like protein (cupin superfamily)
VLYSRALQLQLIQQQASNTKDGDYADSNRPKRWNTPAATLAAASVQWYNATITARGRREMPFYRTDDLPVTEMLPGILRRSVCLDDVMLTFFEFEPEAVIPEHHHPHQQITWVVSGAMEFNLDGELRVLQAGDGVLIPPNVPHSAVVLDGPCHALDAWHPVREDYR